MGCSSSQEAPISGKFKWLSPLEQKETLSLNFFLKFQNFR